MWVWSSTKPEECQDPTHSLGTGTWFLGEEHTGPGLSSGGRAGTASDSWTLAVFSQPFCQDLRRPVYMGPPCSLCCLICLLKMMLSGMCAHL